MDMRAHFEQLFQDAAFFSASLIFIVLSYSYLTYMYSRKIYHVTVVQRSCYRSAITGLHRQGFLAREIHESVGVHLSVIYRSIKRYKELGTESDRSGRGRRVTVTTTTNLRKERERTRREPSRSVRRMARKMVIKEDELLPWTNAHFGRRNWTFQQDGAPAHRARVVQNWCTTNFPDFVSFEE